MKGVGRGRGREMSPVVAGYFLIFRRDLEPWGILNYFDWFSGPASAAGEGPSRCHLCTSSLLCTFMHIYARLCHFSIYVMHA